MARRDRLELLVDPAGFVGADRAVDFLLQARRVEREDGVGDPGLVHQRDASLADLEQPVIHRRHRRRVEPFGHHRERRRDEMLLEGDLPRAACFGDGADQR
jgi:hypothetical protein